MSKFSYPTGRTYNGPQVLDCTVLSVTSDDFFSTLRVQFTDASRGITGTTDLFVLSDDYKRPASQLGPLVLDCYDRGAYTEGV